MSEALDENRGGYIDSDSEFVNKAVPFGLPGSWRIESVIPAGQELIYVGPDASLNEVKTKMTLHGLSQLPVLKNKRKHLIGTVTWRSLAAYNSEGKSSAKQVMLPGRRYKADEGDLLMDHIQSIIENDFIYVKSKRGEYVGIVTTTDLALAFLDIAGPFMKLSEIETRLRDLLRPLPFEDLVAAAVPAPNSDVPGCGPREVADIDDMSIGQYRIALENKAIWAALDMPYERAPILENLKLVNAARNAVMHFRPGGLAAEQTRAIDQALNWLRQCTDRA